MALKHSVIHRDGTTKVYLSPAIPGQFLTFTNKGDDVLNGTIGTGNNLFINNPTGLLTTSTEIQFIEDVQLKDAYVFWENALPGDFLIGEVILPASTPFKKADKKGNAEMINGTVQNITASTTPDSTWTGSYILFPVDVPIVKFLNDMPLYGTNNIGTILESVGVALIYKELKQRLTYKRYDTTPNPNINISVMLEIYRDNTI